MIEKPNDLHNWMIYKDKWLCDECGCCEEPDCMRCYGDPDKPCGEVKETPK